MAKTMHGFKETENFNSLKCDRLEAEKWLGMNGAKQDDGAIYQISFGIDIQMVSINDHHPGPSAEKRYCPAALEREIREAIERRFDEITREAVDIMLQKEIDAAVAAKGEIEAHLNTINTTIAGEPNDTT